MTLSNKYTKEYKREMLNKVAYTPLSRAQSEFMKADLSGIREATLGGASGGGKTIALLISSLGPYKINNKLHLLVDNPEYRGIIFRREAAQLEKTNLIRTALEWYQKFFPKVEYNGSLRRFTFPSGATITFAGCESEDDAFKFKGFTKLHFIGFEELTQFTERQFDMLTSRLRDLNNIIPLRIRCTTNPGDIHEDWVLNRYKYWLYNSCVTPLEVSIKANYAQPLSMYVDEKDPNLPIVVTAEDVEIGNKFVFIETFADDILEDNVQNMGRISDPVLREQLLKGKWGLKSGAGMYFRDADFFISPNKAPSYATRIRYWDKACSGPKGDFLAGALVARYDQDGVEKFLIEDIVLVKPEVSQVEAIIHTTAQNDGRTVFIGIEQEGASAGKELNEIYKDKLNAKGFRVLIDRKRGSKLERAALVSPINKEQRLGYIFNSSINEMMKQLVNFPTKGVHDDAVDAITGAIFLLTEELPKGRPPVLKKNDLQSAYRNLEQIMGTPGVFRR